MDSDPEIAGVEPPTNLRVEPTFIETLQTAMKWLGDGILMDPDSDREQRVELALKIASALINPTASDKVNEMFHHLCGTNYNTMPSSMKEVFKRLGAEPDRFIIGIALIGIIYADVVADSRPSTPAIVKHVVDFAKVAMVGGNEVPTVYPYYDFNSGYLYGAWLGSDQQTVYFNANGAPIAVVQPGDVE